MMPDGLKIAIDLMHVPSRIRLLRTEPLPDGVETLLRIAAGDDEAVGVAVALTGRSRGEVRQAATFFIEQILFAPGNDGYRVLGATPQASATELRSNVALLLRWLHPDVGPQDARSIFIGRVTAAWNDLKTPERRASYDRQLRSNGKKPFPSHRARLRAWRDRYSRPVSGTPGWHGRSARLRYRVSEAGFWRRALSVLFNKPLS
jgi:DnaJ-like protein